MKAYVTLLFLGTAFFLRADIASSVDSCLQTWNVFFDYDSSKIPIVSLAQVPDSLPGISGKAAHPVHLVAADHTVLLSAIIEQKKHNFQDKMPNQ